MEILFAELDPFKETKKIPWNYQDELGNVISNLLYAEIIVNVIFIGFK